MSSAESPLSPIKDSEFARKEVCNSGGSPFPSTIPSDGHQEEEKLEPLSTYAVLKLTSREKDGNSNPTVSVRGVYITEQQAYAAAIQNLIYDLEEAEGDIVPGLRAIAKISTLSLKDRLKTLLSCQKSSSVRLEFVVKNTRLFPEEDLDVDSLVEGRIWPCIYWNSSSDEEEYDPGEDEDGDDDEDDDEDENEEMAVRMDEEEAYVAEGSAKKKQRTECNNWVCLELFQWNLFANVMPNVVDNYGLDWVTMTYY